MLALNDVKNYIRATDEDDVLVQSLMDAAYGYLDAAVDDFDSKKNLPKVDLAVKLLCADWYENRTPVGRPSCSAVELLITQLQLEIVS